MSHQWTRVGYIGQLPKYKKCFYLNTLQKRLKKITSRNKQYKNQTRYHNQNIKTEKIKKSISFDPH